MKGVKLFLIVFGVYLLQTIVMQEISFWGISPNLFLVVTCGISFLFGSTTGGVCGLVFGLLQDMNMGKGLDLMYQRYFWDNYYSIRGEYIDHVNKLFSTTLTRLFNIIITVITTILTNFIIE